MRRPLTVLSLLCAASFLAVVDTTIVTVALPSIRAALEFSPGSAQWILNGYAVVFGGLVMLLGRLGDRIGRRRLFVIGLLLFAAGSALAGLAGAPWVLIAGRLVQGAGAGAYVPASLSLLMTAFPAGAGRSRALGGYGAMAGAGFVVGVVGGGLITASMGWRWVFLISVPLALVAAAVSPLILSESRERGTASLDWPGAFLVTATPALLLVGCTVAVDQGWSSPIVLSCVMLGLICLALFTRQERRATHPLIPLDIVLRREVLSPNVVLVLESMVGIGWLYLLTLYFQDVRGLDARDAGLLFLPMTVASVLAAAAAGALMPRLRVRRAAAGGLTLVAVGLLVMAFGVNAPTLVVVVTGSVIGEAGFMICNVALTTAATTHVDDAQAGLAAGLVNTASQLGGAFGLGVVASVVAVMSATPTAEAIRAGFLLCLLGFCLPGLLLVWWRMTPAVTASSNA